jgi:HEAT repeat protein
MDSNPNPISMPPQDDLTEVKKPTSLLIAQFFLFPLIIIAFGVGIFILFGYIAFEQKSPQAYLNEIRSSGAYAPFDNRRWQAASELANVIETEKDALRGTAFVGELVRVYDAARPDESSPADFRLRRFLASALGNLGDPAAVGALSAGLADADAETQIATLWALGQIGDPSAANAVADLARSGDAGVRKTAVYVLGVLENPTAVHTLQVALNDSAPDVRWNAAMALARLGDPSGGDLLMRLTDREYLGQFPEMTAEQKDTVIVNAVKCLGMLQLEGTHEHIVLLSRNDPSLAVRDAAIEALKTF